MIKVTTKEFIVRANRIHNNKYDYSLVKYVNNTTNVIIICPVHGKRLQTPANHLHSYGCAPCGRAIAGKHHLGSLDKFIKKSNILYNNKYDYSKFIYITRKTEGIIICPKHGEFWKTPGSHLCGNSCTKCSNDKMRMPLETFIKRAKEVHGERYDYSFSKYVNIDTELIIICKEHGEFLQTPYHHLIGNGCHVCGGSKKITLEEFLKRAREIHGDKFDYSKFICINGKTRGTIICPAHGEFSQTPIKHLLLRRGCIRCSNNISKIECEFVKFLKENNKTSIEIVWQNDKNYKDVVKIVRKKVKREYKPDIILKNNNEFIIVELDGTFWHGKNKKLKGLKIHPVTKKPIKDIKKKTLKKKADFKRAGYKVITVTDEEWSNFTKNKIISKSIQKLFDLLKITPQ
jgi:hypothetical protein